MCFRWREPAGSTDGDFMACRMLFYFNEENKLQQQCDFIPYPMCCSNEIKVALCPGLPSLCIVWFTASPNGDFSQDHHTGSKAGWKKISNCEHPMRTEDAISSGYQGFGGRSHHFSAAVCRHRGGLCVHRYVKRA